MVFPWSLSDSKVSLTFLYILTDLINAVAYVVSIILLISNSSYTFSKYLWTVTSASTTIDINVTLIFHCFFFQFFGKIQIFLYLFTFFSSAVCRSTRWQVFFSDWITQGLIVWPGLGDPFLSQNPWNLNAHHSQGGILVFVYTIYLYAQVLISGTILSGSTFSSTHAL